MEAADRKQLYPQYPWLCGQIMPANSYIKTTKRECSLVQNVRLALQSELLRGTVDKLLYRDPSVLLFYTHED